MGRCRGGAGGPSAAHFQPLLQRNSVAVRPGGVPGHGHGPGVPVQFRGGGQRMRRQAGPQIQRGQVWTRPVRGRHHEQLLPRPHHCHPRGHWPGRVPCAFSALYRRVPLCATGGCPCFGVGPGRRLRRDAGMRPGGGRRQAAGFRISASGSPPVHGKGRAAGGGRGTDRRGPDRPVFGLRARGDSPRRGHPGQRAGRWPAHRGPACVRRNWAAL